MPKPTEHDRRFVDYLVRLSEGENRAALAALRRGLGKPPGTAPEMFPWVVPWTSNIRGRDADSLFLVASLLGMHPENVEAGNLGSTLWQIHCKLGKDDKTTERRLVVLLNANYADLPHRLRHAVGLAQSKSVPINYGQLLGDLRHWNDESRWVQRQWAAEFWTGPEAETEEAATTGESSTVAKTD